jgi:serralysin
MSTNENHYCMCIASESLSDADKTRLAGHRAALLKAAKWDLGETITVKFLEGDKGLQKRVRKVAEEWIAPGMANLKLKFLDSGPADIRIAFQQGNGSWSHLGTMCRRVLEPQQPTMNYGWLKPDSSEDVLRRVVLHEFGHALGLIHEHQNPKGGIKWNRDAVVRDLSRPPNNWDLAKIEHNMFKKYPQTDVVATDVDRLSIMMYPIPKAWTQDGFSADLNKELSQNDKKLISLVYQQ